MREEPGERRLLGGYEILGVLGAGGMGQVYRARQVSLSRIVALKVLGAGQELDPEVRARFRREAEVQQGLHHPHVVTLFDWGVVEDQEYLALELVEGHDLSRHAEEVPALPLDFVLPVWARVAAALHFLHQERIVHRDLKPNNILISHQGVVKVSDFGLCRSLDRATLTRDGAFVGTPRFLAPECVRGERATSGADVYSLGMTMYVTAAGRFPYEADDLLRWLEVIQSAPILPLDRARSGMPQELVDLVHRMLAKAPDHRPGMPEVVACLRALEGRLRLDGRAIRDRSARMQVGGGTGPVVKAKAMSGDVLAKPPARRSQASARTALAPALTPIRARRNSAGVLGISLLVVLSLAGYLFARRAPEPGGLPVPSPAAPSLAPVRKLRAFDPADLIEASTRLNELVTRNDARYREGIKSGDLSMVTLVEADSTAARKEFLAATMQDIRLAEGLVQRLEQRYELQDLDVHSSQLLFQLRAHHYRLVSARISARTIQELFQDGRHSGESGPVPSRQGSRELYMVGKAYEVVFHTVDRLLQEAHAPEWFPEFCLALQRLSFDAGAALWAPGTQAAAREGLKSAEMKIGAEGEDRHQVRLLCVQIVKFGHSPKVGGGAEAARRELGNAMAACVASGFLPEVMAKQTLDRLGLVQIDLPDGSQF